MAETAKRNKKANCKVNSLRYQLTRNKVEMYLNKVLRGARNRAVNLALPLKMKIDPSPALSPGGRKSSSARGPRMSNNVEEDEMEDSSLVLGRPEQENNAKLERN